jgi:hypothetical protein
MPGSGSSEEVNKAQKPVIVADDPYNKNKVYIGCRKIDDPPQATFNYGDGKWVMEFKYQKDGKAAERGGSNIESKTNAQDKSKNKAKISGEAASIDAFVAQMI